MLNRRGFLGSLAALVVAPFVPTPKLAPVAPLTFHPNAFALVMEPLYVNRFDVLYGVATIRPDFACRVVA